MKHFYSFFMKLEFLFCCYFGNILFLFLYIPMSLSCCLSFWLIVEFCRCSLLSFVSLTTLRFQKIFFSIYRLIFVVYILLICLLYCFLKILFKIDFKLLLYLQYKITCLVILFFLFFILVRFFIFLSKILKIFHL